MNRRVLAREYGIPQGDPVSADHLMHYLTALFFVAKAGGATIEEELYVGAWSDYLEIDSHIVAAAFERAMRNDQTATDCVNQISHQGLRNSLMRDALRIVHLDGRVDPLEAELLNLLSGTLGASPSYVSEVAQAVERESQLLGLFNELVLQTQPAIPHERLVRCAIDRIRADRIFLLPELNQCQEPELASALAFLFRLVGLPSPRREESALILAVTEDLGSQAPVVNYAQALAWDLSLSSRALLQAVRHRPLQLLLYRDVHRLFTLDGVASSLEDGVLEQLASAFGYEPKTCAALHELRLAQSTVDAVLRPGAPNADQL
jgi:hypothetical protein